MKLSHVLGFDKKKKFIELRDKGLGLKEIEKRLQLSRTSTQRLSGAYNRGDLQREVALWEMPWELRRIQSVIDKCLRAIEGKGVENLKLTELASIIDKLTSAKQRLMKDSGYNDETFRELWDIVSSEPQNDSPMEGIRKDG